MGGSKGVLELDSFVAEQLALLGLEREAEIAEAHQLHGNASLRSLCQAGLALQKLCIEGTSTGLYGRTVVTFAPNASSTTELPSHSIGPGDIVGVRGLEQEQKEGEEEKKDPPSGVVTRTSASKVTVAFEAGVEELEASSNQISLGLVKLANDVTHKRLTTAISSLLTSAPSNLINILMGQTTPSPPHTSHPPPCTNSQGKLEFLDQGLDSSQRDAAEFTLLQRELSVVHGPPGTGKTTTLVEVIRQAVRGGSKVLVCAPSNVAVDNLLERLHNHRVRVVRLGHPARTAAELQPLSLDARIQGSDEGELVRDVYKELDVALKGGRKLRGEVKILRKELREREKKAIVSILSRAEVVLSTLTAATPLGPLKHLPADHFSLTVVDEAGQALEAACWVVAARATKLVLAGDHLQLPPTILSSQAMGGLQLTMMERLVGLLGEKVTKMLVMQYRMHKDIMQWSSDALYEGKLVAADSVASQRLTDLPGVAEMEATSPTLVLVDTAGCDLEEMTTNDGISKCNPGEAAVVVGHINSLVKAGVKIDDIAVVTPYNLQVELLRANLRPEFPDLDIKSVDGFQGREKEVVVLSLVRSNSNKEVGFLGEKRRLNVAVTRGRRQVFVVCDTETVRNDTFLAAFIDYLEDKGEVMSAHQLGQLPSLTLPEGLQTSDNGKEKKKEDAKSQVKRDVPSKEAKTKSKVDQKKNFASTDIRTRTEREERKSNKYTEKKVTSEEEKAERKKSVQDQIEAFVKSKTKELSFPPELSSFERMLVHEVAETMGLLHESQGEGAERRIVVRKKGGGGGGEVLVRKEVKESDKRENKTNCDKHSLNEAVEVKGSGLEESDPPANHINCSQCKKNVPMMNFELHTVRCAAQLLKEKKEKAELDYFNSMQSQADLEATKAKKNKKKKKPHQKENIGSEDDFDSLCEQFQSLDKVCNFPRCKTLVATLGVTCKFCGVRFCLTHSMAEVHGCGEEARSSARRQVAREGAVNPGSGSNHNKPLDAAKRAQLARKLDKKVNEQESQRQRKKKEK